MKALSPIPASQLYHLTVPFKIRPDEGNGAPTRQGRTLHSQIPDHKERNSALFLSVLDLHYSPILLRGGDFMLVRFPPRFQGLWHWGVGQTAGMWRFPISLPSADRCHSFCFTSVSSTSSVSLLAHARHPAVCPEMPSGTTVLLGLPATVLV